MKRVIIRAKEHKFHALYLESSASVNSAIRASKKEMFFVLLT